MSLLNRINPKSVYSDLMAEIAELKNYQKYKGIVFELHKEGKITEMGFSIDQNANLYLGVDLNPELLLYSETSQESVELKMISEKMKKYNEFLTKEGILDSIKVDYERIQNNEYYGYILQISFNFKKYKKKSFLYGIAYISTVTAATIAGILYMLL